MGGLITLPNKEHPGQRCTEAGGQHAASEGFGEDSGDFGSAIGGKFGVGSKVDGHGAKVGKSAKGEADDQLGLGGKVFQFLYNDLKYNVLSELEVVF